MVGEAVADEAETALLDVLLDGVEGLLLGDLHLGVGPAGDLDDHVQDAIGLVGEEGDVVEGRDDAAVLLDEHTVLCGRRDEYVVMGEAEDEGERCWPRSGASPRAAMEIWDDGGYSPSVLGAPMRRVLYSAWMVSWRAVREEGGTYGPWWRRRGR